MEETIMKKILLALTLLLSFGSTLCIANVTAAVDWIYLQQGSTSGKTLTSGYYYVTKDIEFSNGNCNDGITIAPGAIVHIYIPRGVTLTATGGDASGRDGAGAGIYLPEGSSLFLDGKGKVIATGGNAANGSNGSNGGNASADDSNKNWIHPGDGGAGGNGGGGAGAGIGTRGGRGGAGGSGVGKGTIRSYAATNFDGVSGNSGGTGETASSMGNLYVDKNSGISVTANGGKAGTANGNAGSTGSYHLHKGTTWDHSIGGGSGGGGGGFGGKASNIGTGGPGGGGGGSGSSGTTRYGSKWKSGWFSVGSKGGSGGQNGDGGWASGASDAVYNGDRGWESGDNRASGGSGGSRGGTSRNYPYAYNYLIQFNVVNEFGGGVVNTVTAGYQSTSNSGKARITIPSFHELNLTKLDKYVSQWNNESNGNGSWYKVGDEYEVSQGTTNLYGKWNNYKDIFPVGSGTKSDPFIIERAGLLSLADYVNNGSNTQGVYFKQQGDIHVTDLLNNTGRDNKWVPIGHTYFFEGDYDGGGYMIHHAEIANGFSAIGIFGKVTGSIHNLGAEEITINNSDGKARCGAIAGILGYDSEQQITGWIRNCYSANNNVNAPYAGCVVGEMEQNTSMSHCLETTNHLSGSVAGSFSSIIQENATVDMCFTSGGGIAPDNRGKVTNCEVNISASDMASGKVAWLLNDKTAYYGVVWFQDLAGQANPDAYPVLDNGSNRVYLDNGKYTNEPTGLYALSGNGKPDDPFLVNNVADLEKIAKYCNAGYNSAGIYFLQTADLDMKDVSWTPIGASHSFDGYYDGGGHSIRNGNFVNNESKTGIMWAIFGVVKGTVNRLCVENTRFAVNNGDDARVGAIAARLTDNGEIKNCFVKGCQVITNRVGIAGAVVADMFDRAVVRNTLSYKNTVKASRTGYICSDTENSTLLERCYTDGDGVVSSDKYYTRGKTSECEFYPGLQPANFASGEVAYLLNNSMNTPDPVWFQNIEHGERNDSMPVLSSDHAMVFRLDGIYTNDYIGISKLGKGTKESPYKIKTPEELQALIVSIGLMKNSNFYVLQTADIDMKDSLIVPIGTCTAGFEGHYDGGGHVIKNVNMSNYQGESMGLFNNISGVVERLGIENSTFKADEQITRVGAFAGKLTGNGQLRNCYVKYSTIDNNKNSGVVVGALVGEQTDASRIVGCYGYKNTVVGQNDGRKHYGYIVGNIGSNTTDSLVFTDGPSLYADGQYGVGNIYLSEEGVDDLRFKTGELCYLLNNSKSAESTVWRQTIKTDSVPTLTSPLSPLTSNIVYCHPFNEQVMFTNSDEQPEIVSLSLNSNDEDNVVNVVKAFMANDNYYTPEFKFEPYAIQRDYYYLAGWNTQKNGKGTFYPYNGKFLPNDDTDFYAVWEMKVPADGETNIVELATDTIFFKVYDNGGHNLPYGKDYDGKLTLIAPDDCVISLTGTISTEALNSDGEPTDYMTVYDGDEDSETILTNAFAKSGDNYSDIFFSTRDGVTEEIGRLISSENMITIQFTTNDTNHHNGLDLLVTVLPNDIRSLGIGTADNPVQVASAEDLETVYQYIYLTGDSKLHIQQTADIDMAGKAFIPLDDAVDSFEGVYDGGGYTISNLKLANTDASAVGLFRNVSGIVERLGIVNSTFTGKAGNVGAFAGRLSDNGQLRYCYARDNSITLTGNDGTAGVLVGQQADASLIESCYIYHNVVSGNADGQQNAASIVGEMSASASQNLVFTDATTSDFAFFRGELCHQLNSVLTDSIVWYQTLGVDSLPVLRDSHGVVYCHLFNGNFAYCNSDTAEVVKLHLVNVFDSNENKDIDVLKGSYRSLADLSMTHERFVLTGWNTATNGSGTAYALDGVVLMGEDLPLYSQWSLKVEGTKEDPYIVATSADLKDLAEYVYLTGKADFCVKQEADIDMTDVTMRPIGSQGYPFRGTYDGAGNSIRNGKIIAPTFAGVFGEVTGTVTRLGVENMTINYEKRDGRSGGIAARLSGNGVISYCFVKGCTVTNNGIQGYEGQGVSGAIVSDMFDHATIKSCFTYNNTLKATRTAHICSDTKSGTVISNCYTDGNQLFSEAGANVTDSKPGMNAEHFASGEVCWLLNGAQSENVVWRQTLGMDDLPVFNERHSTVYHFLNEQTRQEIYSNASAAPETITITLYYNNGSNDKVSFVAYRQHSEEESSMAFEFLPPVRTNEDGSSIAKWTEQSNGDGVAYQPGDIIKPYNDMTLYAQWGYAIYNRMDFEYHGVKSGKIFLMQDIDLGEWIYSNSFTVRGHFDGCGHTIRYSSSEKCNGLFDTVGKEASVKHLRVEADVTTYRDFGGIAETCRGTISDCHFRGKVQRYHSYPYFAGIALDVYSSAVIDHCSVAADFVGGDKVYPISDPEETREYYWTWIDPNDHSQYDALREQTSSMLAEYPVYAKGILDAVGPEVILGSKTIDAADNHVASLTINDGERFSCSAEVTVDQITYVRRGTNGAYEPWVLPFDYTIDADMLIGGVELYRFVKDSNGNILTKQITSDKPYQVAANEPLAFRTTGGDKYSFQMKWIKNGSSQQMTIKMPTGGVAASMSSKKDLVRVVATYDNIAADKTVQDLMYIWDNDKGDFVLGDGQTGLLPFRYYLQYVDKATGQLEKYEDTDWASQQTGSASARSLAEHQAMHRASLSTLTTEGWQPIILDPRGSQEVTAKMLEDYEILGLWDLYDEESAPGTDDNSFAVSVIYMPVEEGMTLPYAVPLLVRAKHADAKPLVTEQMGHEIDALLTEAVEQMTEDEVEAAFDESHYWCSSFTGRYDVWQFALPEKDSLLNEFGALVFGNNAGDQYFYRVPASDSYTMQPMSYCFTAYDTRTFENLPLANDRIEIVVFDPEGILTGIESLNASNAMNNGNAYNLKGQKVDGNYRGIVIKNGRKIFKR